MEKKYYIGKGNKFLKEECREYKSLKFAEKVAKKDAEMVIWDEEGNVIIPVINNDKEKNEQEEIIVDDKEEKENIINQESEGIFRIEVNCEGTLCLRRSASFKNGNECGRASKGQTYIAKRLFKCEGLEMAETIDGLFLSAASEHVTIDKIN